MEKKLLATLTLVLVSGTAFALPTYYDFVALDANKDGYLSADEYKAYQNSLQKEFSQADKNGDKWVALDEFKESSIIQTDPMTNILPSNAAVSEQKASAGGAGDNAPGKAQVSSASILYQDSDVQGMLSNKVEQASGASVLQGPQESISDSARSGTGAASRPSSAGATSESNAAGADSKAAGSHPQLNTP